MNLKSIGERIKYLRLKNNFTLEELGRKISTSKQTLYKYENGIVTNIPSDKIEKLAEVYNVSPADLMGWTGNLSAYSNEGMLIGMVKKLPTDKQQELERITNSNFMIITDEHEQALIKKYRTLNERGKETVNVVLDNYVALSQPAVKNEVG